MRVDIHNIICIFLMVMAACIMPCIADEENESIIIDPEDIPGPLPFPEPAGDDTPIPMPGPVDIPIGGDTGWYKITSNPSGAQVIFDGSDIGTTPAIVEIFSTGTPYHTVRVEKTGYEPWTRELSNNPGSGETLKIHANLVPVSCCTSLRITSAPSGAMLSINGVFHGYTPKTIDNIRYGSYQISLSREGYEPWRRYIRVSPDEENSYYIVLEPMFAPITSGTLMVESYPEGADIILDRTNRGKTPRTLTLPEGSHSLTINLPGYQQYSTSLFIRDKEQARISAQLITTGNAPVPPVTPVPVIVASPVTSAGFTPDDLVTQGVKAADMYEQIGLSAFISEVNNPSGELSHQNISISVLAENGTLLADPVSSMWVNENVTSYADQNSVPYGNARLMIAKSGGGALYENDLSNTTSTGNVLLTVVQPIKDDIVISTSYSLNTPIPLITSEIIELLSSEEIINQDSVDLSIHEETILLEPNEGQNIFNQTDVHGTRLLPVIQALAFQGGGYCYISEPSGADLTLAYVTGEKDGQATVRWVTKSGRETTKHELIHS